MSKKLTTFRGILGLPAGVLPPQGVTLDIYTAGTETADNTTLVPCTPYNMYYDESACYVIIYASEINSLVSGGKTITGIEIENGVSGTQSMSDFRIDVGHYNSSPPGVFPFFPTTPGMQTVFSLSPSSFTNQVSNLTTCFNSIYFPSANSWNVVNFSTNFIYNGTDDIIILMTNRSGSYVISNRPKWKYGNRGLSFRSCLYQRDSQNIFVPATSREMLTTDSTTPSSVPGSFPNLKIKY